MRKKGIHSGMGKWLALLLTAALVWIGGCSGAGPESSGSETEPAAGMSDGELAPLEPSAKVTIAEDGAASGAGFYIAKEKGYFDKYGIEVEFVSFANSDDMLPALAAGKVDIAGGISTASFFNSIAQGIDVRMIADKGHNIPGSSYFSFVIRKDLEDEIREYADFAGRRIAVSTENGVDDYIFGRMLEHAGLTRSDVEFVLMPDFGNMLASIGNGSIDAALQIEPVITQGEQSGVHVRFGDTTDYAPKAQIAMVLASPAFLEDRKEVALRFMAAYLQGIRDYHEAFVASGKDRDEIIRIMTEYTPLDDEEMWRKVAVTGLDPNGRMFVDDIRAQYEFYKENGAIAGEVDLNEAIDTSLTEQAVDIIGAHEPQTDRK